MQQQMTHRMVQNMRMLPSAAPMASAAAIPLSDPVDSRTAGESDDASKDKYSI